MIAEVTGFTLLGFETTKTITVFNMTYLHLFFESVININDLSPYVTKVLELTVYLFC